MPPLAPPHQREGEGRRRTVLAVHLLLVLYGHWAVNDPRGSGSPDFIDPKFAPLGPIHPGRRPSSEQPSRAELRAFHAAHGELLNFPVIWIDEAKAQALSEAIASVIRERRYTCYACYACAICSNHLHLVIRTHRDKAPTMWTHFAEAARTRVRLHFSDEVSPHHPVISSRPYKVYLYTPTDILRTIRYVEHNPIREGAPRQHWSFVTPYDNWPGPAPQSMTSRRPAGPPKAERSSRPAVPPKPCALPEPRSSPR